MKGDRRIKNLGIFSQTKTDYCTFWTTINCPIENDCVARCATFSGVI